MLQGGLTQYVLTRRKRGMSWRLIALSLRDDIGLDITHETLRSWYFADDATLDEDTPAGAA